MRSEMRGIALLWLISAAGVATAAPSTRADDCTIVVNTALQAALSAVDDPMTLNTLSKHIQVPQMADLILTLADPVLSGFKSDLKVTECTAPDNGDGKKLVTIMLAVESMNLHATNLSMDGTLVDHVPVFGGGPSDIDIVDLTVKLTGMATNFELLPPIAILMDDLTLDLELTRWVIDTDGLMPGTDLGAVFDEFFSMVGPELFDVLELKWNANGNLGLLNTINGLFPPPPPKHT